MVSCTNGRTQIEGTRKKNTEKKLELRRRKIARGGRGWREVSIVQFHNIIKSWRMGWAELETSKGMMRTGRIHVGKLER